MSRGELYNSPPAKVIAAIASVWKRVSFQQNLFQIGKDEYLYWVLQTRIASDQNLNLGLIIEARAISIQEFERLYS
jgi:hypothetical protein